MNLFTETFEKLKAFLGIQPLKVAESPFVYVHTPDKNKADAAAKDAKFLELVKSFWGVDSVAVVYSPLAFGNIYCRLHDTKMAYDVYASVSPLRDGISTYGLSDEAAKEFAKAWAVLYGKNTVDVWVHHPRKEIYLQ